MADRSEPLVLRSGESLERVDVAYETYGSYDGTNAVFVCHPLTCDAHVAAHGPGDRPGWWDAMVGPGRTIDTDRYFVVCANVLGGCSGTTGPTSPRADGRRWGPGFPAVDIADMVAVHRRLLDALGVGRLHAVVGPSMGGSQVLQWLLDRPGDAATFVAVAGTARLSADNRCWNAVARSAVRHDADFRGGHYAPGAGPRSGLATARMIGHLTYLSEPELERRFGHEVSGPRSGPAAIAPYLDHQGAKFVDRFDANSYLTLLDAMDRFDAFARPSVLGRVPEVPGVLLASLRGDRRFGREHSVHMARGLAERGVRAEHHHETETEAGHDAAILELPQLAARIGAFLSAAPQLPKDGRRRSCTVG
ncbi:homoserine O-acetyltransferase MetX [Streptomyces boluensis]|uniref:homoserine O-acetyltransferase MetX n=1 Tax=Streptomyces boluensis TaxID=1775135 RepID=UPI001CB74142|nr:homoserine O-acetyltransferase [Streptomyces boluensis]